MPPPSAEMKYTGSGREGVPNGREASHAPIARSSSGRAAGATGCSGASCSLSRTRIATSAATAKTAARCKVARGRVTAHARPRHGNAISTVQRKRLGRPSKDASMVSSPTRMPCTSVTSKAAKPIIAATATMAYGNAVRRDSSASHPSTPATPRARLRRPRAAAAVSIRRGTSRVGDEHDGRPPGDERREAMQVIACRGPVSRKPVVAEKRIASRPPADEADEHQRTDDVEG